MAPTARNNNNNNYNNGNNKTTAITATSTAAAAGAAAATTRGAAGAAGTGGAPPLPPRRIMSNVQNALALLVALVLLCGLTGGVDGLKCYMCGQYNEGVGSITPCLNYSGASTPQECSKKSEKFCVKYVSELSTVRDCATECAEKEIWETQTYCCDHDGCNGSSNLKASNAAVLFLPLLYYVLQAGRRITLQVRR